MGHLETSQHIDSISPTRLEDLLTCPLRFAWGQQANHGAARPVGDAALKGLAAHLAIEFLVKEVADDVDVAWGLACDQLAAEGPDPRDVPGAARVKTRLAHRYRELADFIEHFNPRDRLTEQWLRSEDSLVVGVADLVLIAEAIAIVDYKTGSVTEHDDVKAAFRRQTLIYSRLASDTYRLPISHVSLFSLRQGFVTISPDDHSVQAVWEEALGAVAAFNSLTPGEQPANASPENCRWCAFNMACSPGLQALVQEGQTEGPGGAVYGRLSSPPIGAANGRSALFIQTRDGSELPDVRVTNVPTDLVDDLSAGTPVTLIGLRRRSDDMNLFVWTDNVSKMNPQGGTSAEGF